MANLFTYLLGVALLGNQWGTLSAETCTYTRTADHRSTGSELGVAPADDIEMCEARCTANSTCLSLYYKDPLCYLSKSADKVPNIGAIHSLKSCAPDTSTAAVNTPASSTDTATPTDTTATGNCNLVTQNDTKGGSNPFAKIISVDEISCRDLCRYLDDCKSVTYDGTQCKLYNGDTTTSVLTGSKHAVKTACYSGINCCLNTAENTTGGNNQALIFTLDLNSCQTLCTLYSSCTGVYWKASECSLYTSETTISTESGSTYISKQCPTGVTMGTGTFTSLCIVESGSVMVAMDTRILVLIMIGLFVNTYNTKF